jgi:hypothetical protein
VSLLGGRAFGWGFPMHLQSASPVGCSDPGPTRSVWLLASPQATNYGSKHELGTFAAKEWANSSIPRR